MQLTRKVALITGVGRGLGKGSHWHLRGKALRCAIQPLWLQRHRGPQLAEPLTDGITKATAITGATLDLAPVLKAAQPLSSDITQDRLLETGTAVVIEHTGAQRGVFLREHDGRWLIVVRQDVARGGVTSLAPVPLESCDEVPRAIIQYVTRTGETVCLDDARSGERFAAGPYLLRQQPKSIVCLPIFIQARLLGILYLEHRLITDALTPLRLAPLQVVASQLAMSLEHAQVQAAVQQGIEDRKQAEAVLQHTLAEVAQQDLLQGEHVDRHGEMARDYNSEEIVGHSPALMRVLHQVEWVTGTAGKETARSCWNEDCP